MSNRDRVLAVIEALGVVRGDDFGEFYARLADLGPQDIADAVARLVQVGLVRPEYHAPDKRWDWYPAPPIHGA